MPGNVIVPKVLEWEENPWGHGPATANGVGYTNTPTNVTADAVWRAVGTKVFNAWPFGYPGGVSNQLRLVEVGVTVRFKSPDNTLSFLTWKLQGRNSNPNVTNEFAWIDVSDVLTQVQPITAWYDNSLSGRLPIQTNFDRVPFELQVVYQTNTDNVVQASMKNSGYVRYQYRID